MHNEYQPRHLRSDPVGEEKPMEADVSAPHEEPAEDPHQRTVHPQGVPMPDGMEIIPIPGSNIAPNGAIVRNPWSQQPEITPPYAYTDEQEDQDLLIM